MGPDDPRWPAEPQVGLRLKWWAPGERHPRVRQPPCHDDEADILALRVRSRRTEFQTSIPPLTRSARKQPENAWWWGRGFYRPWAERVTEETARAVAGIAREEA